MSSSISQSSCESDMAASLDQQNLYGTCAAHVSLQNSSSNCVRGGIKFKRDESSSVEYKEGASSKFDSPILYKQKLEPRNGSW